MALPKIDLPMFECKIPSTGEIVKYRPFTVKEEKILLVGAQAAEEDPMQQIMAIKQVVNNCLIDTDVSKLAMFDLEFILLMLRARSVDNNISFEIIDPDTQENVKLELDIDAVVLTEQEGHSNEVRINDEYTLFLKYPTIDEFIKITAIEDNDPLASYFVMVSCLDKVASEDEVFDFAKHTQKEVDQFMEDVSGEVVKGIKAFFDTMPKLRHEMKYTNKNGDEKTFVVEGIRSFFS